MVDKILELLKYKNYSVRELANKLDLSENEMNVILNKMLHDELIYLDIHNKYCRITDELIITRLHSDTKGHKFIYLNKEKLYILPENLHTAFKNDLIVVDVYHNEAKVEGILERKNNKLICEVVTKNKKTKLVPFNTGCEVIVSVTNKELLKNLVDGDRVIVTLDNTVDETNTIFVKDATRIGHKNDPKSDELAIAISKDFDIDFSKEAIIESLKINDEVMEVDKVGRVDLTKEIIFTIDSITTKDMDDAVSIKKLYNGNYLLGVHIADVAHYIKPNTALFKDAEKRATSLYLGDTVIPMIPHKLSNGICSLNEGVDRLTKSVLMEIEPTGKLKNYKIINSVINSKKKMTYEELNMLFNDQSVDESYLPFLEQIQNMRELSNILTKSKQKRGNIEFESNDIKVENDELENPISFTAKKNEEAESIIENFMILANETVASYFYWQDLPFIYRVHNIPDEIKIENTIELIKNFGSKLIKLQNAYGQKAIQSILKKYSGTPEYSIISNLLLKNMQKAEYSTTNIGHYALALDNYCHFTSPIRRFPDLMIHTLLDMFNDDYTINNKRLEEKLEDVSHHSSYKERQADDAERDYLKLKMAKYMEDHLGEEFEGIILDIDHESVIIKLDNNIKGILAYTESFSDAFVVDSYKKELKSTYSKTKAKLGTKVLIKVHEVNVPQKEIFFELIEIQKNKTLTRTKNEEI